MKRTHEIKVRLNDEELATLNQIAHRAGRSRESVIRDTISGIQIREAPPLEYPLLIRELRAAGNNLNQLAVLAHIHGFLNETQLHETILELRETEKLLCAGLQ